MSAEVFADFGEVLYRPWFLLLFPGLFRRHLDAGFEECFYLCFYHLPFCAVYDVPGSDAVDVVSDCAASVGSGEC